MKEIQNLRTGYSREKIFVSTGETHNFMREDRAYDDHLIVIRQSPVDFHLDRHGEESARKLGDLLFRNKANLAESVRVIPLMVKDANIGELGGSFATCDLQARTDCLLGHRKMGSNPNKQVEGACH